MGVRIANVVFDVEGPATAAPVADLYAELLGMTRTSRGDWYRSEGWPADEGDDLDPLVLDDDPARPNLAFETPQPDGYRPPRWPDPQYPQQLHLDLEVPDLAAAAEAVRRHGGAHLGGAHLGGAVYADAGGHPFCLATGPAARIARIVLDGDDPDALERFWHGLVGEGRPGAPVLAFQRTDGPPPRWPDPLHPQQVHLDLAPEGVAAADLHARAEALGAVRQPFRGGGYVFTDPFGHPFCLGEPAAED